MTKFNILLSKNIESEKLNMGGDLSFCQKFKLKSMSNVLFGYKGYVT